jgi:hypothetical protein
LETAGDLSAGLFSHSATMIAAEGRKNQMKNLFEFNAVKRYDKQAQNRMHLSVLNNRTADAEAPKEIAF